MINENRDQLTLKLYVNGTSGKSRQAMNNLRELLDEHLPNTFSLEIIDISQDVEALDREHILATPTLIKKLPSPSVRIIGDLSNSDAVLAEINTITN